MLAFDANCFSNCQDSSPGCETISTVFYLCSASRWINIHSLYYLRRLLTQHGVSSPPGVSLWIRLLQAAGLLDTQSAPEPTFSVPSWLDQPLPDQFHHLLATWTHMPSDHYQCRLRERLVEKLKAGQTVADQPVTYQREASGLRTLGLIDNERLTWLDSASSTPVDLSMQPKPAYPAWSLENRVLTS